MPDGDGSPSPLVKPRVVRVLRDRPRLVDFGLREEALDELDTIICERRDPANVAEDVVREGFNKAADAAAPPVRNRVRSRLQEANEGILNNI